MKFRIVKDSKGQVVAAYTLPHWDNIPVEVELEKGQVLDDIEMPDDYMRDPDAFFKRCAQILKKGKTRPEQR